MGHLGRPLLFVGYFVVAFFIMRLSCNQHIFEPRPPTRQELEMAAQGEWESKVYWSNLQEKAKEFAYAAGVLVAKTAAVLLVFYLLVYLIWTRTFVLRRLRRLAAEKVIKKIHGFKNGELSWILTQYGAYLLHDENNFVASVNKNMLEHDILINDIRFILEDTKVSQNWCTEQRLRRQHGNKDLCSLRGREVIPDAVFIVNFRGQGFQPVALELELSPKNPKRVREVFLAYKLKPKMCTFVWYLVMNKSFGQRLERGWNGIPQPEPTPRFCWLYVPEILELKDKAPIYPSEVPIRDFLAAQTPAQGVASSTPNFSNQINV